MQVVPAKLKKGDTVATISPSWGCAGARRVRWEYEQGCRRLEALGLKVVSAPNSLRGSSFLKEHPEARAEDVNWAFENKEVKAIIANIGGNDAERILPYLSEESIRKNPKILCGYSDVLALHLYCYRLGLMTFYGDNLLTNIAENGAWHPYSRKWFEKCFFEDGGLGSIEASEDWSYDPCKHTDKGYRKNYIPNRGYLRVQGRGKVRGRLFGGHGELLKLKDPSGRPLVRERDLEGCIFFFEDIPECCRPSDMAEFFDSLGRLGLLQRIRGIIIGKMRMKESFDAYASSLREVIGGGYGLTELPVMADMNFGHTSPVFILPYGMEAELDMDRMRLSIGQ
ncbi:MAG: LD-carboxypeptidase [Lachnospiraceae bacterium]|nr:LD-carboxypeptidase [Lachnospiraceae bacterium]